MPLYTEFLFNLHKKFQVASKYNIIVEYQIWSFFFEFFFIYTDNTHSEREQQLKILYSDSGIPEGVNSSKNLDFENLTPKQYSLYLWVRESNKLQLMNKCEYIEK